MDRITARILYDEIVNNTPDQGLYVWTVPDENSVLKLQRMMNGAPFKTVNSTGLHCTVLYHSDSLPFDVLVPEDRPTKGEVFELTVWPDRDEWILVASLKSPTLQAVHHELLAQGFSHGFPEYNPHITVGKNLDLNLETRIWIQEINDELAKHPLKVVFHPHLNASSIK